MSFDQKRYEKERREERKAQGLCVYCAAPAKEGHTICQECLNKKKQYGEESRLKRKQKGICKLCNNRVYNNTTLCKEHWIKHQEYKKQYESDSIYMNIEVSKKDIDEKTGNIKAFTTEDIAMMFKVNNQVVRNLINKGQIPSFKFGNQWLILESDLYQYISDIISKNKEINRFENISNMDEILTLDECSKILKISKTTTTKLIKTGKLKATKIGTWRVIKRDVFIFLEQNRLQ